ncbi:MAG: hypothetical protein WCR42_07130 [bacterium]
MSYKFKEKKKCLWRGLEYSKLNEMSLIAKGAMHLLYNASNNASYNLLIL